MHGPYHLLTYQCMLYNCFNLLKMLYQAVRMCACSALIFVLYIHCVLLRAYYDSATGVLRLRLRANVRAYYVNFFTAYTVLMHTDSVGTVFVFA